ncbi:MAG: glycosyltransferase family 9 protein [Flavobacteriia bacterium]|jgi:heptosyltransferase-2
MTINDVHFDCRHFRGAIPCKPNKLNGAICTSCTEYSKIEKRILIIKLGALGDVIRTTPLVVRFRKMYPNAQITWLTQSPDILPKDGQIDIIYRMDAPSLFTISNSSYDLAINLDKEPEACILLDKVKAQEKYGYIQRNGVLSAATPAAEHKLMTGFFDDLSKANTKSYPKEIFEICHLDFQGEDYLIQLNDELAKVWRITLENHATGAQIVGLNTGCGPRWNTRLWSENAWIELATKLREEGYFPVFLGGELEHEKNVRMSHAAGVYYPGHFSLAEFIALTDSCDFVVTQVSMMMHIATALKKKMVLMNTIFNRHEFELYGRGVIIEPPSACECYYGNTCVRGNSCMHDITPAVVCEAVKSLK